MSQHPGARVLFLRRTFADLNKPGAAIDRSRQLLSGRERATWSGQEHRWTFSNGSVLQFGHLQHPGDMYGYQGAQFDVLLWDELTQFAYEQYQFLRTRVRATVAGLKTSIRAATNPGGVGHGWVRQRFIDAASWGEPFTIVEGSSRISACFIPAKVSDNTALLERDPRYAERLGALPEALRRAYLEGDWDQFAGQVFTEWRRERHVVEPFQVPKEWPRWRAVDYGLHAPMCCLWLTRSPAGAVYVYRELYGTNLLADDQALRIRSMSSGESYRTSFGDPSMWNRTPMGASIAELYAEQGIGLVPANNDRVAGWQLLHQWLAWSEGMPPRLKVFSTCSNLIRTLPALVYDATRVEDVDSDGEDHAPDALRYGAMGMSQMADRLGVKQQPYSIGKGAEKPLAWDPFRGLS